MSTLVTLLTIGLVVRLTRLLVVDQITYGIRARIVVRLGPENPVAYLITCSWCLSVWVSAAVFTPAYWFGSTRWWFMMAAAGTASLLAGYSAIWLDPANDDEEAE